MKTKILNLEGKESKEIELPKIFSSKIREDITQKVYEAEKKWQPYAPFYMAGKQHSASGIISHQRHKWKTAYGRGISRVPRKILWRRGTQFYWIGAEVSGTRGGRHARIPRVEHFFKKLKINKKEKLLALNSAISATASSLYLKKRYSTLEKEIKNLPLIVDSSLLKLKTGEFFLALKKILDDLQEIAVKKIRDRKGRIKSRTGKRKSAGLLLVIGNKEEFKVKGVDVRNVNRLEISDLYPLGRLTVYTENAIKDLEKLGERK